MINLKSVRNPKTGRFQTTTDSTKYKMVQFNNQRMSEHSRAMCIALNIQKIPKGFIIHHIDKNKRNNNIDNLALMSITAHNRIHSHEAWNKGIKTPNETLFKIRKKKDINYLKKFKETYDLITSGKTQSEVATEQKISRGTVYLRVRRYKELIKKYE